MKNVYRVGSRVFKTKHASYKFGHDLIYRHGIGTKIRSGKTFDYLNDLLKLHPEHWDKVGEGIDYFGIGENEARYLTTHFVDKKGDLVKFSWYKLAKFQKTTKVHNLINAMRQAIIFECHRFRTNAVMKCVTCGSCDRLQVDHKDVPFKKMRDDFWMLGEDKPDEFDDHKIYNCAIFKEEDHEYENAWIEYHNRYATYQILCSRCNQVKGSKVQQ
tara:strand:+ start:71 stop:715 length:645 start_codon:yes stop_codon:yes gene_type:complete